MKSVTSKRAAQYVRMSTEHQQYSTANQKDAIAAYAAARSMEIVATYEDAGKSGLTLSGRPSLRKLIADVVGGQDGFDIVLVYDVSRWGRFQDADESAHLEYMCRMAGVHVEYCAEPFANDGTPFANICKVIKRALAAEYSRELSEKVYAGKRRLIHLGFRQGGGAGYGLRRCLIDESGTFKAILRKGERKCLLTDRVVLVPGPPEELAIVNRIFCDYLDRGLGYVAIASALNQEGVASESGRPWSKDMVKKIITSEKYVGDNVWGRTSFKLQIARQHNPRHTWARLDNAFNGVVDRLKFEKAQKVRAARAALLTNEQIVGRLRIILRKHGLLTARLVKKDGFVGVACVRKRFGSLITAYELAGYRTQRDTDFVRRGNAAQRLRAATARALMASLRKRGQRVTRLSGACRFLINNETRVTVTVAQQRQSQRRAPRWLVKPAMTADDIRIAVLMDARCEGVQTYYFLPAPDLRSECYLALRNTADLQVLCSKDLQPLYDTCDRQALSCLDSVKCSADENALASLPMSLPERKARRLASVGPLGKTYAHAFNRASKHIRKSVDRATSIASRLDVLRKSISRLLSHPSFRATLSEGGVTSVPLAVDHVDSHFKDAEERAYRRQLRETALKLLAEGPLAAGGRRLLSKLNEKWRIEAAEMMVLANDTSAELARALVAATPACGLRCVGRKHPAEPQYLKWMVKERDYMLRASKPAYASLRRNSLDLVVVESFARRLAATPSVVDWLNVHDEAAYSILSSVE